MITPVRIEIIGPIELMGVVIHGNPAQIPFHSAWELFGETADENSVSRIGKDLFGLQIYSSKFQENHEITYMTAIEKPKSFPVPIRMFTKTLQGSRYIVQKVQRGVNGLDNTLRYLYEDYIPNNGYIIAAPYDFEKYTRISNHENMPEQIEIWIPVI